LKIKDIADQVRGLAPEEYAASWDNVGLQVGDEGGETAKVLITLTVTAEVIEEAQAAGAGLIVSHHPLIFQSLRHLDLKEPVVRLIRQLLVRGITLYVAHTNLDVVEGGVSAALAEALELKEVKPLTYLSLPNRVKLVTFVPLEGAEEVRQAVCEAGAGRIGNYQCCTFQVSGEGSFEPRPGASPSLGEVGELSRVEEARLEVVVEKDQLNLVLDKLQEAHPYEEPAIDVFALEGLEAGLGRVGKLPSPMTLKELGDLCRERLDARGLRFVGDAGRTLERIAVCGGSGEEVIEAAAGQADVLVTGDIKYHAALRALDLGLHVIDAGHAATEKVVLPRLASFLTERLAGKGVEVLVSHSEMTPWRAEG
jgi:dinuclear metal center YbgI/SA1388 family protein